MSSLPTYAPGPGVRPEALGMPKRLLVPNEEVCWVDFRLGKDAMVLPVAQPSGAPKSRLCSPSRASAAGKVCYTFGWFLKL